MRNLRITRRTLLGTVAAAAFLPASGWARPEASAPDRARPLPLAAMAAILSVPPAADARYIAHGLGPYDAWDVFLETQRATFAETWAWEARDHGLDFEMPVLIIQGANDLNAPVALARAWFDDVRAPAKAFEVVAGAGHNVLAFSDQVLALIDRHVGPWLARATDPGG